MLPSQAATLEQLEDEAERAVNERDQEERTAAEAGSSSAVEPPAGTLAHYRRAVAERYSHEFTRGPGVPGTPRS
eukprot:1840893-Alexandrium_andersonii.AAC.1